MSLEIAPPNSNRIPDGTVPQVVGQTKEVAGTVNMYKADKGFCFVGQDDGKDVFFHVTALARTGLTDLAKGQRVRIVEELPDDHNVSLTARKLGIHRRSLQRMLNKSATIEYPTYPAR